MSVTEYLITKRNKNKIIDKNILCYKYKQKKKSPSRNAVCVLKKHVKWITYY